MSSHRALLIPKCHVQDSIYSNIHKKLEDLETKQSFHSDKQLIRPSDCVKHNASALSVPYGHPYYFEQCVVHDFYNGL